MTGVATPQNETHGTGRAADPSDLVWSAPLAMATIAHEIRNPLLSVSANMELLRDQLDRHDPRRRCVDRALADVDRLSAVVDRLVDFASTHRPNLERCRLDEFLDEVLDRERAAFPGCVIELELNAMASDSRADDCEVELDAELLGRVVSNLVRNAIESMHGEGRVRVSVERRESDEAIVVFEDEGDGVSSGLAERIFEPFVTTKPAGTGLGLPFSRRIARVHGGDLRAVAQRGGRFELVLPIAGRVSEETS